MWGGVRRLKKIEVLPMKRLVQLAEAGLIPDALIRIGIRHLLAGRLKSASPNGPPAGSGSLSLFTQQLRGSALAISTEAANEQHYEVPVEFFRNVLGPRLKYSSCDFASVETSLAEAEAEMLRQTCERAELEDGMKVLELGCGWGSLTLWIAEHFPGCEITALSNSASQREFIEGAHENEAWAISA